MTLNNVQQQAIIDARRVKVAEMYRDRKTQREIAAALNISLATVNSDIKAMRGKWQQASQEVVADRFEQQLERYEEIYTLMRDIAFNEKSARYAEVALKALERIDKLVGTEAPEKREIAGRDGDPLEFLNMGEMSDERLDSLIASLPN